MLVAYARTSTLDQVAGFEAQLDALHAAGADRTFKEQVSSVGARLQLDAASDFLREGDALVVTKLDRLARSTKGASLRALDLNLDTATATGRLMLTVIPRSIRISWYSLLVY